MTYLGSKRGIAGEILAIILKDRKPKQWFVEPFCGGCNITSEVPGPRIAADIHADLIAMWQAVSTGWTPPEHITREHYAALKSGYGELYLRGWAAVGCSYSGKYWGGYAGPRLRGDTGRNKQREQRNAILKQAPKLAGVNFVCASYNKLKIPPRSLIYCDPPYEGTTGYGVKFDHATFWAWCRDVSAKGNTIFISEQSAPPDFVCVWQKEKRTELRGASKPMRTEKLFILKGANP